MDLASAFAHINWLSVVVAAISAFLVGGIWYGPLFGKVWMKAFHFTEEDLKKRSIPKTFGLSLFLAFVAALTLEMFIGVKATLMFGLLAGVGWVATLLGILYLFEMQTMRAYAVNAGYCIIALTVMEAILGAW
ncbi:hypothetical protein BKI52_40410 [marine bacterium AO1-C]|nr:hypothetical protein BKI52_40410 [marine bacterium AO1-C]